MPLKIKFFTLLSLLSLFFLFSLRLEIKIIACALFLFSFFYLLSCEEKERKEKENKEKSLSKLETLYNDLDEQAKVIVQTDLKLSKAEEELNKRISGLYILQDIGRMISNTKNFFDPYTQKFNLEYSINKMSEIITNALVERLEFEKSSFFLIEEKTCKITYCTGKGYSPQEKEKINNKELLISFLEEKEVKEIFIKNNPTLMKETFSFSSKLKGKIDSFFSVSSFAIVPIVVQKNIVASIFVGNGLYYDKIDEQDLEFLSTLGNISINVNLEKCLKQQTPFSVCYIDIDEFKAFNDRYGFEAGDKAIQKTAHILKEALKNANPADFIGHIGGDDFILITTPDKVDSLCISLQRGNQQF